MDFIIPALFFLPLVYCLLCGLPRRRRPVSALQPSGPRIVLVSNWPEDISPPAE